MFYELDCVNNAAAIRSNHGVPTEDRGGWGRRNLPDKGV
jgi:hypothetical protein